MGAEIGVPIALGMGSVAGSLFSSSVQAESAETTNAQQLAFARQENETNRNFQREMFDKQVVENINSENRANEEWFRRLGLSNAATKELTEYLYKNFNSPQAQAKALRAAGVNPAAFFGNGGSAFGNMSLAETSNPNVSQSSSPSVGTPSSIQPNLRSPYENFDSGVSTALDVASRAYMNVSKANKMSAEQSHLERMSADLLRSLQLKNANQETQNAYDDLKFSLESHFGRSERAVKLSLMAQELCNAALAGDSLRFDNKAKEINNELLVLRSSIEKSAFNDIEKWALVLQNQVENQLRLQQADLAIKRATPRLMQSETSKNFSLSSYYKSLQITEDKLRDERFTALQYSNDLQQISKYLQGNELAFQEKTFDARVYSYLESAHQAGIITQQEMEKLSQLKVKSQWSERQEFAQYVGTMFNCLSQAIESVADSYSKVRGTQWRHLDTQESNKIRSEFNRIWEEKQKEMNTTPNKSKGVGSIMEHIRPEDQEYYRSIWQY